MNEFGDFEEIKEETTAPEENTETPVRVRTPRRGQFLGIVIERLGGNRMSVKTTDGKTRNCRVPGKYKRKFWLRTGNAVLIEPWIDDDSKGDIVYQYRPNELYQLKKRGLIVNLEKEF